MSIGRVSGTKYSGRDVPAGSEVGTMATRLVPLLGCTLHCERGGLGYRSADEAYVPFIRVSSLRGERLAANAGTFSLAIGLNLNTARGLRRTRYESTRYMLSTLKYQAVCPWELTKYVHLLISLSC
jgi:hypothetical protein